MFGLTQEVKGTQISNELFSKDKIKKWYINWDSHDWSFNKGNHYSGNIEFRNGDISGSKQFKATTLEDLFKQMDDFIKNL